ncbi:TPA: hypothetical protein H1016_01750 [archaeon]|uniref:Uncharacterized protein n=1 Tax=Candidatus Naiadarchaeum limnaeum TaxID=2756139 RepID=A0A832V1D1_9ARCH|nr:hypothetical protein [Candidatus Naiadarchaeum limnaeum]
MTLNEIALFLAGGFTWDVVLHLALAASRTKVKMFGITFTGGHNKTLAITNAIIAVLLLWYALA